MSRFGSIWGSGPPVLKALAAQALGFLFLLSLAHLFPGRLPFWLWVALQALLAASLAAWWGLGPWWRVFQILVPVALGWQLGHAVSAWVYPSLLAVVFLVFGGGILTRVPLYNSGSAAWDELLTLIPEGERWRVVDLGAGLGGPLAALAHRRPEARFIGVEASPLVWLIAWLRCLPWKKNCRIQAGSLWRFPLAEIDLAFAFLSPAPMAALWEKACTEMKPGTLLISHSFQIPGVEPERRISLPGRPGACLLLYRIPKMP
ncbi:MAG: class I SAM-dependent methyltransferase [Holophaga sp.]|nr:class I SAM-dependent methyltransferase [Holophaga sp.]